MKIFNETFTANFESKFQKRKLGAFVTLLRSFFKRKVKAFERNLKLFQRSFFDETKVIIDLNNESSALTLPNKINLRDFQ